jgi:hypothetical protein
MGRATIPLERPIGLRWGWPAAASTFVIVACSGRYAGVWDANVFIAETSMSRSWEGYVTKNSSAFDGRILDNQIGGSPMH